MASLRKRISKWALGTEDPYLKKFSVSMDVHRGSVDSGYCSTTQKRESQATTLLHEDEEESPKASPRGLHKTLSTTFNMLAEKVRLGAAYIYQDLDKPDDDQGYVSELSDFETPKETPKKHRRRSSFISSVRSRKGLFSPKKRGFANESLELPLTPTRMTAEKAPILDVEIPASSWDDEGPKPMSTCGSMGIMTGVQLPSGPAALWTRTVRAAVGRVSPTTEDPYTDRDDLSARVRSFVTSALATNLSGSSVRYVDDIGDIGYVAEVESPTEKSDTEDFFPVCLKYVAPGSPEAKTSSACSHHPLTPISHSNTRSPLLRKEIIPPRGPSAGRLASAVYEADAELSETSPGVAPSMGSRAAWEDTRADRHRRYQATIWDDTDSDSESPGELQLSRSPTKLPVHYAHDIFADEVRKATDMKLAVKAVERDGANKVAPMGDLRYAVEAIERPTGDELAPERDLHYAVEAIERLIGDELDPAYDLPYAAEAIERPADNDFPSTDDLYDSIEALPGQDSDLLEAMLRHRHPWVRCQTFEEEKSYWCPILEPFETNDPQNSMQSMRLTVDEIMTLGANNHDGQDVHRSSSESDTDCSVDSPLKRQLIPVSDDPYEAGLRAAGLLLPRSSRQSSGANPKNTGSSPKSPPYPDELKISPMRPISHLRSVSDLSDSTNDSCAVTTRSPSCSALPPLPVLHFRSEPVRQTLSVLNVFSDGQQGEIPLRGPENIGLPPSSPLSCDEVKEQPACDEFPPDGQWVGNTLRSEDGTPHRLFNAARLPKFGSPSPLGTSTMSRRSSLREKKARGKLFLQEVSGNAKDNSKNPSKVNVQPEFCVKHFEPKDGVSPAYAGHELDPDPFRGRIREERGGYSHLDHGRKERYPFEAEPPVSSQRSFPLSKGGKLRGSQKDLEDLFERGRGALARRALDPGFHSDLAWKRYVQTRINRLYDPEFSRALTMRRAWKDGVDPRLQDLRDQAREDEKCNRDEAHTTEKPRWRVPSKITDSTS